MKLDNLDIYERIFSSHWFLTSYNGIGFVYDLPKVGGGSFITQIIYIMEKEMCRYIFDREEFEKAAHFTANKLINNHKWRGRIYKKIDYFTEQYFKAGENLRNSNLQSLPDGQIAKKVRRLIYLQHYHQMYSVLANGVVIDGRNHLSDKIRAELQQQIKNPKKFEDYWTLLSQSTRMSLRQRKDYELALLANKVPKLSSATVDRSLQKLHAQYCWLDYNNMGPAATLDKFRQELKDARRDKKNLDLPKQLANLKNKQKNLIKKLKLNTRSKFLINLAQGVIWQKGYRKDVQYHGFYCYESLFKDLARRKKVTDWQDLSFLFPWEVEEYIKSARPNVGELKRRRQFSIFTVSKQGMQILSGEAAKKLRKKIGPVEKYGNLTEAKGQCAYTGKVRGTVKIIQTPADMIKMNKGDILMSQATSPDLLPAMKKASAIVTNTGGLICHAAITSRELKIPCIVGTANATLIFKDGDAVEVNANQGTVKKFNTDLL